jgi:hypothetical protein
MKNGVFFDVTMCGSCKNRRFGGTYRLHHQSGKNQRDMNNVVASSFNLSTLMMETIVPPKCSFLQEPHFVTSQNMVVFLHIYLRSSYDL